MKRQPDRRLTLSVDAFGGESVNLNAPEIGARIKAARNALGMTQDALAKLAGSPSKAGLQHNESGRAIPGGQMIGTLVAAGVNANWLLMGKGPMLIADLAAPAAAQPSVTINVDALVQAFCVSMQTANKGETVEQTARRAVAFYQYCWDQGLITATGEGEGLDAIAS